MSRVDEAAYMSYFVDSEGKPANGAKHSYTLHFAKDQLPPADALQSFIFCCCGVRVLASLAACCWYCR